ncbi:hypothetical protein HAX54_040897 [Datura stramonium]|uniref:Uncharacterized protein n=1 Tax=Datura stramonium TaxID=4076 RepID=A0ABS8VN89_DATST|nr:hypothetical protein [Datura stramonium]
MVGFVEGFDGGAVVEGSMMGLLAAVDSMTERSGDVPSSIPSKLTTVSGMIPPEFFSSCLGSEGTFKESVSKTVPSFGAGAFTWLVEDGTRPILSSSSFSYKSVSTKMLESSKII